MLGTENLHDLQLGSTLPGAVCARIRHAQLDTLLPRYDFRQVLDRTWCSRYWADLLVDVRNTELQTLTDSERLSRLYLYVRRSQYQHEGAIIDDLRA